MSPDQAGDRVPEQIEQQKTLFKSLVMARKECTNYCIVTVNKDQSGMDPHVLASVIKNQDNLDQYMNKNAADFLSSEESIHLRPDECIVLPGYDTLADPTDRRRVRERMKSIAEDPSRSSDGAAFMLLLDGEPDQNELWHEGMSGSTWSLGGNSPLRTEAKTYYVARDSSGNISLNSKGTN